MSRTGSICAVVEVRNTGSNKQQQLLGLRSEGHAQVSEAAVLSVSFRGCLQKLSKSPCLNVQLYSRKKGVYVLMRSVFVTNCTRLF